MGAKPPKLGKLLTYNTKPATKIATSNLFIEQEPVNEDVMTGLIFEEISGNELINIQPYNFLTNTSNSNISNINSITSEYEPKSLFKSSNIQESYFGQFEIKLNEKIPLVGNGTNGSNVYFALNTNLIYIELINILDDEEVEVQFLGEGTPIGDTIEL